MTKFHDKRDFATSHQVRIPRQGCYYLDYLGGPAKPAAYLQYERLFPLGNVTMESGQRDGMLRALKMKEGGHKPRNVSHGL